MSTSHYSGSCSYRDCRDSRWDPGALRSGSAACRSTAGAAPKRPGQWPDRVLAPNTSVPVHLVFLSEGGVEPGILTLHFRVPRTARRVRKFTHGGGHRGERVPNEHSDSTSGGDQVNRSPCPGPRSSFRTVRVRRPGQGLPSFFPLLGIRSKSQPEPVHQRELKPERAAWARRAMKP